MLVVDPAGYSPPYDLSLQRSLEAAGIEVRLLMPRATRILWEDADACPNRRTGWLGRNRDSLSHFAEYGEVLRETLRLVEEWKPDVVHFQWLPLPVIDLEVLKRIRSHAKLVLTMHNVASSHEPRAGVRGWRRSAAVSVFDRVIVHSAFSASAALRSRTIHPSVLRVVPHGVLSYYRELVEPTRLSSTKTRLLFLGSIKPYKGLDMLIESLAWLAERYPEGWNLQVAGAPSYSLDRVQARARELNVDRMITWTLRHVSEREAARFLRDADVVVLPYREIDQSGVLLAAVGMRRAVVTTSVGAFPEIIEDGKHGLLVEPAAPAELARALGVAVSDAKFRADCELAMDALANGALSWTTVATATISLYSELLDGASISRVDGETRLISAGQSAG